MSDLLLLTLLSGSALTVTTILAARRLLHLDGTAAAAFGAMVVILVYSPVALWRWPGADVFAIHLGVFLLIPLAYGLLAGGGEKGRWHWGPVTLVMFFVVLAVVDGALITAARHGLPVWMVGTVIPAPRQATTVSFGFPGVSTHDFQEKEAQFNAYLERRADQAARGWQVSKGWVGPVVEGRAARFRVEARDAGGAPISGAVVDGRFVRTADSRQDQDFVLVEVAPGRYEGDIRLPLPGRWDLVMDITVDGDRHEVRARTEVSPS